MAFNKNMAVTEKEKEYFDQIFTAIKLKVGKYFYINEHNSLT
jgi:hypothetical protein